MGAHWTLSTRLIIWVAYGWRPTRGHMGTIPVPKRNLYSKRHLWNDLERLHQRHCTFRWARMGKFDQICNSVEGYGGKKHEKTISKTRRLTHRPFAHHWLQMLSANSIPSEPCSQRCGPTARCCEDPCATCRAVFLCDVETRPWKMCGVGDSRSHEVKKFQTKSNKWILKRTINGIWYVSFWGRFRRL